MLYLSGTFLSFFLSFLLLTKKGKSQADFILMAWLILTGFHLLTYYLHVTGQFVQYPTLIALGVPLPLIQGPFLYLYTLRQTRDAPLKAVHALHFLPLLLSYVLFSHFFFLTHDEQVAVFNGQGDGFEVPSMINLYAIYISGVVYCILSLRQLLRYRRSLVHQFSSTDKINFNWLLYLIGWIVIIWVVILVTGEDKLIFGAAALFVLWLGYFGLRQNTVFVHNRPVAITNTPLSLQEAATLPEPSPGVSMDPDLQGEQTAKYQKSGLTDAEASRIHQDLLALLDTKKPYTNPELSLNDLADMLLVNPNVLSQVINSRENKNFYDLVNERRTEEFIRRLSLPARQQFTLMAIAYDCGFNSKASFNRNFKKYTGLTPTEYLDQLSR